MQCVNTRDDHTRRVPRPFTRSQKKNVPTGKQNTVDL